MNTPINESGLQIREAGGRDTAAILRLYRQLVWPVAPEVEVDVRADRIEQIRSDLHNFLWVLESEEGVVGTAFVTLCLDPMHNRQPYAVLENFVIDERCRAGFEPRPTTYHPHTIGANPRQHSQDATTNHATAQNRRG
jgi:hypothetical protein